jgi:hypothetical protein
MTLPDRIEGHDVEGAFRSRHLRGRHSNREEFWS